MEDIQKNLQTDFFNKLKPALRSFPSYQFRNPVLCVRVFIQDGDTPDDETGTYEANRRVEFLMSHQISFRPGNFSDSDSDSDGTCQTSLDSLAQSQPLDDRNHNQKRNAGVAEHTDATNSPSRKRKGGLRLAPVSGSASIDDDVSSRRQMHIGQQNFPKRAKVKPDGVFQARELSLSKFVVGVWEQIHSGLILEPLVLTEQVHLIAPGTIDDDADQSSGQSLAAIDVHSQTNHNIESFSRSNLFCRRVTQASRTCRSIEVIVQARWIELFDSYVDYLGGINPELSPTKTRMRAIAEACTDFGWTEKELRNKMAIWRGYKEIKDALGWAALVFSGMGLYRLCKYRIGFDVDRFYKARAMRLRMEVAADTLHPNWRQLLAIVSESTERAFTGHPHDWVVYQDGSDPIPLRSTYLKYDPQFTFEHIDECVLDTASWGADDPRWIPPQNTAVCIASTSVCDLCGQLQSNEAALNTFPFDRGVAIGEFVGLVTKGIEDQDVLDSQVAGRKYQIWQGRHGNFTRFANHSCKPNAQFEKFMWLGTQHVLLVSKGIEAGMEITVDYSGSYWRGLDKKQAGTRHVYGVPGDFTLKALDHLPQSGIKFVGCCNELNAGYAADGYARSQRHQSKTGLGALITTYGVGELSAANAVAGSYAEYLPVVHIVGTWSQQARRVSASSFGGKRPHRHIHHTLADSRVGVYREIAEKFTVAQLDLAAVKSEEVPDRVDWVLSQALHHSRPVYIELPSDVVATAVPSHTLESPIGQNSTSNDTNESGGTKQAEQILQKLYSAKRPLILVDRGDGTELLRHQINEFVQNSGIPTVSLPSGASMVDNSLPNYFGVYSGLIGAVDLTSAVKSADLVLAFGCQFSDTQTLGWAILPERDVMVVIGRNHIEDEEADVGCVLAEVNKRLNKGKLQKQDSTSWCDFRLQPSHNLGPEKLINQDEFYIHLGKHLQQNDTVLLANATPIIGGRDLILPPFSQLIASGMWFSIGHMLPAALGVAQAKTNDGSSGRTILLDGDGSFQMTAQELSTIIHNRVDMTIFIINNSGYTYERYIHGMDEEYNDVAPWDYSAAPQLFGQPEGYSIHSCRVKTWEDLDRILTSDSFVQGKGLTLVDVIMDKYDISEKAKVLFEFAGKQL
ncbi:hypothetical protein KAF25_003862 [Fusarium avenaceum]|uniref:Pyruvate decarboxylase n=1 Tax=Fusarium avenaceum TaxID=40199 RepID=A0A9P7GY55_9HYPO|nr:hypothetical protein KAF25_003862 [Fusarium avenaceum]